MSRYLIKVTLPRRLRTVKITASWTIKLFPELHPCQQSRGMHKLLLGSDNCCWTSAAGEERRDADPNRRPLAMLFTADPGPSGYSGSQWSQQGRPVSDGYSRPGARMQLGVPAYDLRRFTEGPSLHINGTPDAGSKRMLATGVRAMRHGHFATGNCSRSLTASFKVD